MALRRRHFLRKYLLTGLAIWLPVIVTFYLLRLVFLMADGILGRYINRWIIERGGQAIPGLGLVLTVTLLLVTGYVANHFFGRRFVQAMERWFGDLPIIRYIYPHAKQMADLVFTTERRVAFRRVVLVPYPSHGLYSLAFVTNESLPAFDAATGKRMVAALVPNTPSPLTGWTVFVPAEDVVTVHISVEEGTALVMSGGVVGPGQGLQGPASRLPHSTKPR